MSFKDGEIGMFVPQDSQRTVGPNMGWVTVKMDSHALAYIIKGINSRISVYEKMESEGPLPDDDQTSFDYNKRLLRAVRDARDRTLVES